MPSKATTVEEYLAALPEDRREALEALRGVINANIDPAFEEGMQYGMPAWYLPHSAYPAGYHCDPKQPLPFVSIASQKSHIGLYLFCVFCNPADKERFVEAWKASGHRLDMGAGCVRCKTLDQIPLDVVGKAVKRATPRKFVRAYEANLPESVKAKRAKAAGKSTAESIPERGSAKKTGGKKAGAEEMPRNAAARKKTTRRRTTGR